MKILCVLDKGDYEITSKKISRQAVRAVIIENGKVAMVKSLAQGFYKFPGGGIEENETHIDTLVRETLEETGLHIKRETIKEFGVVEEIRKSNIVENNIFAQTSFYYFAERESKIDSQNLEPYEAELGYKLEFVDMEVAYQTNFELSKFSQFSFLEREAVVLRKLIDLKILEG